MVKFSVKEFWHYSDNKDENGRLHIESQINQFLQKRPEIQIVDIKHLPPTNLAQNKTESRALLIYRTMQ